MQNEMSEGRPARDWQTRVSDGALKLCGLVVGRQLTQALSDMQRAQHLSASALRARSETRLAQLLQHAVQHVPFYRAHCAQHGLRPADLQSTTSLAHLPTVNKAFYRTHGPALFTAENLPAFRRLEKTTSGSTGEPFRFCVDRAALPVIFASHLFYDSWFGLRPFDRYVRILAPLATAATLPPETPPGFRWRQALTARLQRLYEWQTQRKLWLWEVNAEKAAEIWRAIEAFGPRFLLGYTSTLASLCNQWLRSGAPLSRPLRGVITIAETLTPTRRRLLNRYFQAPLINRYGLREFGSWSAQSCPAAPEHLHVNTELVVCEILRADDSPCAPGETGRVVLTDLWNEVRPFIRYDTGDLAVAGPSGQCACGRGFPRLGAIAGRSLETLRTPTGREISPAILGHFLFVYHDHQHAIRQYQLIQETPDRARLLVVPEVDGAPLRPGTEWNETRRRRLEAELAAWLSGEMQIHVEAVPLIPPEPSGKRPIIKLLVPPTPHDKSKQACNSSFD